MTFLSLVEEFSVTVRGQNLTTRLRDMLEKVAAQHALPGLAASVSWAGREIFADGFGNRDADGTLEVTADTMFAVASVTKFLTAVIIMQAKEQQLLKLSDPVSRYYPELDCARDGRMQLRHLLTHTAGFPGLPFRHVATVVTDERTAKTDDAATPLEPAGVNEGESLITPADLVNHINALNFDMLGSPGGCHSYSNESYCLLGGIIEDLYQCSFAEAAEEFVFKTLHMERSAIGGRNLARETNIAMPMVRTEAGLRPCGFWEAPLFYPAGGLITTVRDMVRLISTLDGDAEVLSQQQGLDMIWKPAPIASRPHLSVRYGFGLEVEHLDANNTLAWHTGQRPGVSSFIGHVLQQKVSVALAVNTADAPTASIGHQIIAEVLEGELIPKSCLWPPLANQVVGKRLETFCGCYGSQEMGEFRVHIRQGQLILDLRSANHEFRFTGPRSGTVGEQTFCFLGNDGNAPLQQRATALALDLRVLPRLRDSGLRP